MALLRRALRDLQAAGRVSMPGRWRDTAEGQTLFIDRGRWYIWVQQSLPFAWGEMNKGTERPLGF